MKAFAPLAVLAVLVFVGSSARLPIADAGWVSLGMTFGFVLNCLLRKDASR